MLCALTGLTAAVAMAAISVAANRIKMAILLIAQENYDLRPLARARTWLGGSVGHTEPYLELNIMVPCWPVWPPTRPGKTRRRKLHRLPARAIDRGRRQGRGVQI